MTATHDRERNPDRTREAILDAAERLFADQGYDATSLSQVGQAAGVSRGTPGYFFGSKPDLYRAVLERCFGEVRRAVASGRERALASGETPEVVLAGAVGDYFDFLVARPSFLRLLERQALGGGSGALPGGRPPRSRAGRRSPRWPRRSGWTPVRRAMRPSSCSASCRSAGFPWSTRTPSPRPSASRSTARKRWSGGSAT